MQQQINSRKDQEVKLAGPQSTATAATRTKRASRTASGSMTAPIASRQLAPADGADVHAGDHVRVLHIPRLMREVEFLLRNVKAAEALVDATVLQLEDELARLAMSSHSRLESPASLAPAANSSAGSAGAPVNADPAPAGQAGKSTAAHDVDESHFAETHRLAGHGILDVLLMTPAGGASTSSTRATPTIEDGVRVQAALRDRLLSPSQSGGDVL